MPTGRRRHRPRGGTVAQFSLVDCSSSPADRPSALFGGVISRLYRLFAPCDLPLSTGVTVVLN